MATPPWLYHQVLYFSVSSCGVDVYRPCFLSRYHFPVVSVEEANGLKTLDQEEAVEVFAKVLARFRDDIPKSGSHDSFLEGLMIVLRKLGVAARVPEMRAKKQALRELFRRKKRDNKVDHHLYDVLSVVYDGKDKSTLKSTKFEWSAKDEELLVPEQENADEKFTSDLIKYSESKYFPSYCKDKEM